ncbi:hypothetical protein ZWY2020_003493, partial [Hordeum vulgare]
MLTVAGMSVLIVRARWLRGSPCTSMVVHVSRLQIMDIMFILLLPNMSDSSKPNVQSIRMSFFFISSYYFPSLSSSSSSSSSSLLLLLLLLTSLFSFCRFDSLHGSSSTKNDGTCRIAINIKHNEIYGYIVPICNNKNIIDPSHRETILDLILPDNGARNSSCYLLSLRWFSLEEERVMQHSS